MTFEIVIRSAFVVIRSGLLQFCEYSGHQHNDVLSEIAVMGSIACNVAYKGPLFQATGCCFYANLRYSFPSLLFGSAVYQLLLHTLPGSGILGSA